MIPKRLDEIVESDIESLQANSVAEGKTIDYKQSLPANTDDDRKEFLADGSSFANTAGGDLIFGIVEAQGLPSETAGLTISDLDAELRRLESIIPDGLDPRVKWAIRGIQRGAKPPVLIVRTERSWIGPHRVIFKAHDKFYARNSGGKYPMDVSELRSAFTLASTVTDRARQFRIDRIGRIRNNQTPIPLVQRHQPNDPPLHTSGVIRRPGAIRCSQVFARNTAVAATWRDFRPVSYKLRWGSNV